MLLERPKKLQKDKKKKKEVVRVWRDSENSSGGSWVQDSPQCSCPGIWGLRVRERRS